MSNPAYLESPIGTLVVESDGEAITNIQLPYPKRSNGVIQDTVDTPEVIREAAAQLEEYFAGKRTEFDLRLQLEGTEFQREVWLALAEIPHGKTISYAELASMVGRPTAFRAVGQANGKNPIPIVLPCHRVIASGGGIGGYGGGLEMKRRLLSIEGVSIV